MLTPRLGLCGIICIIDNSTIGFLKMSIISELSYLSSLLKQSTETTLALGEEVLQACKNIQIPDKFKTVEEANQYLFTLNHTISPAIHNLTGVIANANVDDLGNQCIMRIMNLIDEKEMVNPESWTANRLGQDEADLILQQIQG
jgi:chemotaxis regulatin CheY-phosphate phosphatase CheZ